VVGLSGAGAVKAVLFDLGGTLWAPFGDRTEDEITREAAVRAARMALSGEGPEEQVRRVAGALVSRLTALKPARKVASQLSFADAVFRDEDMVKIVQDALERASQGSPRGTDGAAWSTAARAASLGHDRVLSIAEQFGHDLTRHYWLYPETPRVLSELRSRCAGLVLGIVSNTTIQPHIVDFYLAECGLDKMVDFRILSSELGWRKPHPAIYAAALARAGAEAANTVFVGDRSIEDVAGSKRLGMKAILCCFAKEARWRGGEVARETAPAAVGGAAAGAQEPDATAFALADVPGLVQALTSIRPRESGP